MLDLDGTVGSSHNIHIHWSTIKLQSVTPGKRQWLFFFTFPNHYQAILICSVSGFTLE